MSVVSIPRHLRPRSLAIAIFALAILALWALIFAPLSAILSAPKNDIAHYTKMLSVYQMRAGGRAQLENILKSVQAREASLPGLSGAANAALVAAQMQSDVKAIVEAAGGTLRSTANLPPRNVGSYEEVKVRFDLSLPMDHLGDALYSIETHSPFLFLDDVEIGAPENFNAGDPNSANPALQIQWTTASYRWAGRT
jgi:general secretion pathway protein M